jgi:hypothetical protein
MTTTRIPATAATQVFAKMMDAIDFSDAREAEGMRVVVKPVAKPSKRSRNFPGFTYHVSYWHPAKQEA